MLKSLIALGAPMQFNQSGNIAITAALDTYSKMRIQSSCTECCDGGVEVLIFLTIDSTNTYLKSLAPPTERSLICITEQQTAGRGRRGKRWASPFASNVYFSYRGRVRVDPQLCGCISLISGLATIQALESLGFKGLQLKWPNDIYVNHKKLAGMLIEVVSINAEYVDLVIGIGLNVKMPLFATAEIEQPWTDLHHCLSAEAVLQVMPSRTDIVIAIVNQLVTNLRVFEATGLPAFYQQWNKYDLLQGRSINVRQANKEIHGVAAGINECGELRLQSETGIIFVNAGEVSVRFL